MVMVGMMMVIGVSLGGGDDIDVVDGYDGGGDDDDRAVSSKWHWHLFDPWI